MYEEKRKGEKAIPDNIGVYLNDLQRAILNNIRKFGWSLRFVRRPSGQQSTIVIGNNEDQKLGVLEKDVAESERAVEIYREQRGLGDGATSGLQDDQLLEINGQLIVARAERTQAEARLAQLRRLAGTQGQSIEMAGDVLSSPLVQQLRTQQAETISRAYELSLEYGPKHPRMLQVNAEIEDINQRVGSEMAKITLALENEVELARDREQNLQKNLREFGLQSDQQSG